MLKVGQIIEHQNGGKGKILGIAGVLIGISMLDEYDDLSAWQTEEQLIKNGFTLPKERWKPKRDERYHYMTRGNMMSYSTIWTDDDLDNDRYNIGNVFKTEEEAAKAAEKVKDLLLSIN